MASRGLAHASRTFTHRVGRASHLAPTASLFHVPFASHVPSRSFGFSSLFGSTAAKPGGVALARAAAANKQRIGQVNKLRKLSEPVEALKRQIEKANGISIFSIFKGWLFWRNIEDPRLIMELAVYLLVTRRKLGGMWHDFENAMRKNLKFKKKEDEDRDHFINVGDVCLKVFIQSIRDKLPTRDELEVIIHLLNERYTNVHPIPKVTHDIKNSIEEHIVIKETVKINGVDKEIERVKSISELYNELKKEDKEKLDALATEGRKNFLDELQYQSAKFAKSLEDRKTPFLKSFGQNLNDFLINHRISPPIQKGGAAKFTKSEQKLYLFLVQLIGKEIDTPAHVSKENENEENNENGENIRKSAEVMHELLKRMKAEINKLFKNARTVYQTKDAPNQTRNNNHPTSNNNHRTRNNNYGSQPAKHLVGGKTYKKRR
jgi:hypothetical protein